MTEAQGPQLQHGEAPDTGAAGTRGPMAVPATLVPASLARLPPATAQSRAQQLSVRLQRSLLRAALDVQYRIARVGVAGQAGLAVLTAALVIAASVLLPARQALLSLGADLARTQGAPAGPAGHAAAPQFLGQLPTRAQMPAVVAQIYQQAKAAGVALDSGRYAYSAARSGDVSRYEVEFPIKASYPVVRDFINRTLTAVPAAGLDRLHIERKSVADGSVSADVRFVIFVRGR